MNWNDSPLDPLDDLLQKAEWPEPSAEHVERLQDRWRQTVRRRNRRIAASWAGLAAMLLIGLAALWIVMNQRQIAEVARPAPPVDVRPLVVEQTTPKPKTELAQEVAAPSAQSVVASQAARDPTAYELAASKLHRRRIKNAQGMPVVSEVARKLSLNEAVAEAVRRLANDPKADLPAVAQSLAASYPNCELAVQRAFRDRWFAALNNKPSAEQLAEFRATLRLLSQVGTPKSLPVFLVAAKDADCPAETLDAIARLSTAAQLALLANREKSPQRQQRWLAAILKLDSAPAMTTFLQLAGDPSMTEAACRAMAKSDQPPVEELFRALSNSRVSVRLTAARLLGSLNDPAVSERLVQMAMNQVHQREALLALLSSSDPVARRFVAAAQNDVILAASLRAVWPRAKDL